MKVRFTPIQAQWLQAVTGEETTQDAVDFFIDCMRKEGIPASEIMAVMEILMEKKLLPPGQGDR